MTHRTRRIRRVRREQRRELIRRHGHAIWPTAPSALTECLKDEVNGMFCEMKRRMLATGYGVS